MRKILLAAVAACAGSISAAVLENDSLKVDFNERNGAFGVTDKRNGRVWAQFAEDHAIRVTSVRRDR